MFVVVVFISMTNSFQLGLRFLAILLHDDESQIKVVLLLAAYG